MFKRILLLYLIPLVFGDLNLPEGSPCEVNGVSGKCVNLYTCETVIDDWARKRQPLICSRKNNIPYVCCTSCKYVKNITDAVIAPNGNLIWKTGRKSFDKCLDYSRVLPYECRRRGGVKQVWDSEKKCFHLATYTLEVVGGRDAYPKEFPHMALLGYGPSVSSVQWLCGGTIVSERYILTAAHCTSSTQAGPVTYVGVGLLSRTDDPDLWRRYTVSRIVPHPEYRAPAKYHDIALLQIDGVISFSSTVLPACLVSAELMTEDADYVAHVSGWGATGYRQTLANHLQTVSLEKFSQEECESKYRPHRLLRRGYNGTTQMCYGGRHSAADSCDGDSGGPLQVGSTACISQVIGVTSYGRPCGFPGEAGMYTRVQHYVPWIESVVWG